MIFLLLLNSFGTFAETNKEIKTGLSREEFLEQDALTFEELIKIPGTIVVSEYDMIKSLQSYSDIELQNKGYSDEKINEIRSLELSTQGAEIQSIGASIAFFIHKNTYFTTGTLNNGSTRATVIAYWAWDKAPYSIFHDAIAFLWGKDLTTEDQFSTVKVDYLSNTGITLGTRLFYVDDKSPNRGCSFVFPIGLYSGITSGRAFVELYNSQQALKDIEVRAEYGHSLFSATPSVSWPGGVSIKFNPITTRPIDYDFLTLR